MKILMLCGKLDRGGAETHIATLIHGLDALGVEITAVTAGGMIADALERDGIRIFRLPIHSKNPLRYLPAKRKLKMLLRTEHFDILHAHTRLAARFLHLCKAKSRAAGAIVTMHAKFRTFPLSRQLCDWGDGTIAVSEDLRAHAIQVYHLPPEGIAVIPNGIDLHLFPVSKERLDILLSAQKDAKNAHTLCENEDFASEGSKDGDSIRILFASRMDRDCCQGAELLLELAPMLCRHFPALRICIAGGGDAYKELRARAEKINEALKRNAIEMPGHTSDMPQLLAVSDIFVGVSRAAMEAAAMGCAVILCGNEGYGGILDGENAPVEALSNFCARNAVPASAARLEKDLLLLLKSREMRIRSAYSAMEWVRTHLDAEAMCRSTLAFYHRFIKERKKQKLLVGGYFGCGNLGDDAILQGMRDTIADADPTVKICALTAHPRQMQKHLGISCYHRKSPLSFLRAMIGTKLYLCGGGSLLQNKSGNRSLFYYLLTLWAARFCGKQTVLFSAGIGPLSGRLTRRTVAKTLKGCRYISVREEGSLHFLRKIGVTERAIMIGADPALLLAPPPASRAAFLCQKHGIAQDVRCFCVILRGGREAEELSRLVLGAVRILISRYGMIPIFLTFDRKNDRRAVRRASERIPFGAWITPEEVHDAIALLGRSEFVISMRLHGLILSTVSAVPALGIVTDARDEKIPAFARLAGQDYLLPGEVSVGSIVEMAERLMAERTHRIPFLRAALADLRKKAKKDLENILAMLYNNRQNE